MAVMDAIVTSLEQRLKDRAADLGFALSGFAPATAADGFDRFAVWLDRGYAGEMEYLHRLREERRQASRRRLLGDDRPHLHHLEVARLHAAQ